jgi:hypothetical protein
MTHLVSEPAEKEGEWGVAAPHPGVHVATLLLVGYHSPICHKIKP